MLLVFNKGDNWHFTGLCIANQKCCFTQELYMQLEFKQYVIWCPMSTWNAYCHWHPMGEERVYVWDFLGTDLARSFSVAWLLPLLRFFSSSCCTHFFVFGSQTEQFILLEQSCPTDLKSWGLLHEHKINISIFFRHCSDISMTTLFELELLTQVKMTIMHFLGHERGQR